MRELHERCSGPAPGMATRGQVQDATAVNGLSASNANITIAAGRHERALR
jgi:hypothetical protein